jgi:hypothetical protein
MTMPDIKTLPDRIIERMEFMNKYTGEKFNLYKVLKKPFYSFAMLFYFIKNVSCYFH